MAPLSQMMSRVYRCVTAGCALIAQTRYGSSLPELDLRGRWARQPDACRDNDENAPFLWLDDGRKLAVIMPQGRRPLVVERDDRYYREVGRQSCTGSLRTGGRCLIF